jgi:hypothetical protein
MLSKHSKLVKRQTRDWYGRFSSPSSRTAPPPSRQEVGSLSRHRTAPPPSRLEEASFDDSVKMWMLAPPLTCLEVDSSSDDSPSDSLGYNDECPHIKEVSSYELLLDFNCLVQLLNVSTFIFRFKS